MRGKKRREGVEEGAKRRIREGRGHRGRRGCERLKVCYLRSERMGKRGWCEYGEEGMV